MAICLERAVLFAFRLCCFMLNAVKGLCSFPVCVLGRMWNSIVSVSDHCPFSCISVHAIRGMRQQDDLKNDFC